MELHVVRPIFILLLWGFTLGLKAVSILFSALTRMFPKPTFAP